MPSRRSCRIAGLFFAALALLLAFAVTPAGAAVTAPHPAAATPAKGPGPRGEFSRGHIRVRGQIRGAWYCVSSAAHPKTGSFIYLAPCEPRDANEWWECVKFKSFGSCAPASAPALHLGQQGRSALAQLVNPNKGGTNWILQFLPLSPTVSVIRVVGFHGYFLTYPDTVHRVNPVFWGTGRNRGWSTELVMARWYQDPL